MTPQALLEAIRTHDWMPVFLMLSLVVRTWLTDRSKFPLSLPINWQPVVVAVATGFVNAVAGVQAGESASAIVMTTLAWAASTGFLDGVLVAIWGDPKKAPVWGRFIVMAFDDLEKPKGPTGGVGEDTIIGGPVAPSSSPTLVVKVPSLPPKPVVNELIWLMPVAFAGFGLWVIAASIAACASTLPGLPGAGDIAKHFADQDACLYAPTSTTRAAVDACRAANMVSWCKSFPAAVDCAPSDAGAIDGAVADVKGAQE